MRHLFTMQRPLQRRCVILFWGFSIAANGQCADANTRTSRTQVASYAAQLEHRLQQGSKPIFHLEVCETFWRMCMPSWRLHLINSTTAGSRQVVCPYAGVPGQVHVRVQAVDNSNAGLSGNGMASMGQPAPHRSMNSCALSVWVLESTYDGMTRGGFWLRMALEHSGDVCIAWDAKTV